MIDIEQLKNDKEGLEEQLQNTNEKVTKLLNERLMIKGALMYVNQNLERLQKQEEKKK